MLDIREQEQELQPIEFDEVVDNSVAYDFQSAKLPFRQVASQVIRVPVSGKEGQYQMITVAQATRVQFLAAIRDAVKIKYCNETNINVFIQSLFCGEFAVSKRLDDLYERWYVLEEVIAKGAAVERRLFGALLSRSKKSSSQINRYKNG